ncbi:5'-nucleotidase [Mycena latifolia]|nr:5'-nucleotidase [Mycena latifolia]
MTNLDGEEVYVVTAYRCGEYLGRIDVEFDPKGKVASAISGLIHLTNKTVQDADLQAQIEAWRVPFDAFGKEVIGETVELLNHNGCKTTECNFGDLICDAMLAYRANQSDVAGYFLNGGGIRVDLPAGNVTREDAIAALPFGNPLTEVVLTGKELWDIFAGEAASVSATDGRRCYHVLAGHAHDVQRTTKTLINLEIQQGGEMATVDFGASYRRTTSPAAGTTSCPRGAAGYAGRERGADGVHPARGVRGCATAGPGAHRRDHAGAVVIDSKLIFTNVLCARARSAIQYDR